MSDDTLTTKPASEPETKPKPVKAAIVKPSTITLRYVGAGASGDTLSIGDVHYPIEDNIVKVLPEHLETAQQASFQP